MFVAAGQPFTATLITPPGVDESPLGARIEVPVTRAIVGYWRTATLDGYVWSVGMEAPPARMPAGGDPALAEALAAGEFQLVWMTGDAVSPVEIFVPLRTFTGTRPAWPGTPDDWPDVELDAVLPTVADVAALLRTRTYTEGVHEQPTFGDDTRPPAEEVQALIVTAAPVVLAQLRPRFPETLYGEVAHVIALYVAVLVEGSYFREQLDESQVALYRDLFNQSIAAINETIDAEVAAIWGPLRLA